MAATPEYAWPTPDDSDLVRDGAAAIRALGDAIDSTMDTVETNSKDASNLDAGTLSAARVPAGSIVGFALGTDNTVRTRTATTYANSGLEATITPKLATSRLVVMCNVNARADGGTGNENTAEFRIVGPGDVELEGAENPIGPSSLVGLTVSEWTNVSLTATVLSVDTSARTYRLQFRIGGGTPRQISLRNDANTAVMYVFEVA
jgi:hypothetical protein